MNSIRMTRCTKKESSTTADGIDIKAAKSVPALGPEAMRRRSLLRMAGVSIIAAPFSGMEGFTSMVLAQPASPTRPSAPSLPFPSVVTLPRTHPLSELTTAQSRRFLIGKQRLNLELDIDRRITGTVAEIRVPRDVAQRLKTRTAVMEGAMASLVPDSRSARTVKETFVRYGIKQSTIDALEFSTVTARRRVTTGKDRFDILTKVPVSKPLSMIVGHSSKDDTVFILLEAFTRRNKLIQPPILKIAGIRNGIVTAGQGGGSRLSDEESTSAADPPEPTKEDFDFAACFLDCAKETELLFGTLAAALGTACVVSIAALPATAGLDAIIALPACVGTLIVLGSWVAICAATCGVDAIL